MEGLGPLNTCNPLKFGDLKFSAFVSILYCTKICSPTMAGFLSADTLSICACIIALENTNNMKWLEKDSGGRDLIERWIDRHNHKLELVRTLGSLIAATTGVLVFLKVFNII